MVPTDTAAGGLPKDVAVTTWRLSDNVISTQALGFLEKVVPSLFLSSGVQGLRACLHNMELEIEIEL